MWNMDLTMQTSLQYMYIYIYMLCLWQNHPHSQISNTWTCPGTGCAPTILEGDLLRTEGLGRGSPAHELVFWNIGMVAVHPSPFLGNMDGSLVCLLHPILTAEKVKRYIAFLVNYPLHSLNGMYTADSTLSAKYRIQPLPLDLQAYPPNPICESL